MKLEKREITLNEKDSLLETAYSLKQLFFEYGQALSHLKRKESRKQILINAKETGEDMCFLFDLAND
jgi:hypothetical protein